MQATSRPVSAPAHTHMEEHFKEDDSIIGPAAKYPPNGLNKKHDTRKILK